MRDDHDDFGGLRRDHLALRGVRSRREMLRLVAGASVIPLVGCSTNGMTMLGSDAGPGADAPGSDAGSSTSCSTVIPDETEGPYPGDGTNGPNALTQSGIVRNDIRSSLGGGTTAAGVPLTVTLALRDTTCAPLAGYAVYLWHCNAIGEYSLYTGAAATASYLRGVAETDASGQVTFTTIFPGCYPGRWPHIHFEIYESLDAATSGNNAVKTTQLALPEAQCSEAYAVAGYEASVGNLSRITLATDGIFADGSGAQVAVTTGSAATGFAATLPMSIRL